MSWVTQLCHQPYSIYCCNTCALTAPNQIVNKVMLRSYITHLKSKIKTWRGHSWDRSWNWGRGWGSKGTGLHTFLYVCYTCTKRVYYKNAKCQRPNQFQHWRECWLRNHRLGTIGAFSWGVFKTRFGHRQSLPHVDFRTKPPAKDATSQ